MKAEVKAEKNRKPNSVAPGAAMVTRMGGAGRLGKGGSGNFLKVTVRGKNTSFAGPLLTKKFLTIVT